MIRIETATTTTGTKTQTAGSATPTGFAATLRSVQHRGRELDEVFTQAAKVYNLPPELLRAIAFHESGFDPNAVSPAGAMGLMQLMPVAVRATGVTNPFDPVQNVMAGAKILRGYLDQYNGDLKLALAAYGAGSGSVARHGGVPPYQETQKFVEDILSVVHAGDLSGWDHTGAPVTGMLPQQNTAVLLKSTAQVRALPAAELRADDPAAPYLAAGDSPVAAVQAATVSENGLAAEGVSTVAEPAVDNGSSLQTFAAGVAQLDTSTETNDSRLLPARETQTESVEQTGTETQDEQVSPPSQAAGASSDVQEDSPQDGQVPTQLVKADETFAAQSDLAGEGIVQNAAVPENAAQRNTAPEAVSLEPSKPVFDISREYDGNASTLSERTLVERIEGKNFATQETTTTVLTLEERALWERMASRITTGRPTAPVSVANSAFSEEDYEQFVKTLPYEEGGRLLPPKTRKQEDAGFYLG